MRLEAIMVRSPVVIPHQQEQLGGRVGLAQSAPKFDQEALEEYPLAPDSVFPGRVRGKVATDNDDPRVVGSAERHQLFVEGALAMEVGGKEPHRHVAPEQIGPRECRRMALYRTAPHGRNSATMFIAGTCTRGESRHPTALPYLSAS